MEEMGRCLQWAGQQVSPIGEFQLQVRDPTSKDNLTLTTGLQYTCAPSSPLLRLPGHERLQATITASW